MRKRCDGEETRGKIVGAAAEVFGEFGYHQATFAEMARRGGFNAALISFHFGSKDELYRTVWRTLQKRVITRWPADGGLAEDAPAEERLRAHVRSTLNRLCDPDLAALHRIEAQERVSATGLVEDEQRDHIEERRAHMRGVLGELLGEGATDADVDLCEMSVTNQLFVLRRPRGKGHRGKHREQGGHGKHHRHCPKFSRDDIDRLVEHITRFSLGGIQTTRQMIAERGAAK